MSSAVICVHGFLGEGNDWKGFSQELKKQDRFLNADFWCPDLLSSESELNPNLSISQWAQLFNAQVSKLNSSGNCLVGYSMGGRLALHAYLENPALYSGLYLFSVNPFMLKGQLDLREKFNAKWADLFLNCNWEELAVAWQEQDIFKFDEPLERLEANYSRQHLANCFNQWPLEKHTVSRAELENHKEKIHWLVGEKDEKYLKIYEELRQQALINNYQIVPGAGHRLGIAKSCSSALALGDFFVV